MLADEKVYAMGTALKTTIAVLVVVLPIIATVLALFSWEFISQPKTAGANVRCLREVCDGMPASVAFSPSATSGRYGRLSNVTCGYSDDFVGNIHGEKPVGDFAAHGCSSNRYVVSFDDDRVLTNFWIQDDEIARIDEYPRHVIDF